MEAQVTNNINNIRKTAGYTLIPPTLSKSYTDFEYSVHEAPKSLKRELMNVFPNAPIDLKAALWVIPTFQKSSVPLLEYGDAEALEKDRLLERFFQWCTLVCRRLHDVRLDLWVDAADPASGMAWKGAAASCYSDVDGIVRLLHYETMDIGGCRVVIHPQWRSSIYPATLFTIAPPHVIANILQAIN